MFLEECAHANLTPVQFGVLTVLNARDDALDQITIASLIGVDRNTAADVIRRLEGRGLIERPESVHDKRVKLARITDRGRAFVGAVQPSMIIAQKRLTDALTRGEYDTLMQLMRKMINANNDASRAPMRQP